MRQRGAAFLIVLWLLALLAVVLGGFALIARSERLMARHLLDGTQARYAAEAGVHRAVYALALPDPTQRWLPDGRPYRIRWHDFDIEIRIVDESGKIDLNAVDPGLLERFFKVHGVEPEHAAALASAVVDWRDPDDLLTPNGAEDRQYEQAGLGYGAKDAPFDLVSELQQVLGMNHELYRRIEPALTINSGLSMPNPAFAQADVLQALGDFDPALVQQLIEQRHAWTPTGGTAPPVLPDGTPIVASAGGGTYSIMSRARMKSGAFAELDTVVRLGGAAASGLAFAVLRWQDGSPP